MKAAAGPWRRVEPRLHPDLHGPRTRDDDARGLRSKEIGMGAKDEGRRRGSKPQRHRHAATPDEERRGRRPTQIGAARPPLDPSRRVFAAWDPRPATCLEMDPPTIVKCRPSPRIVARPEVVVSIDPMPPGDIRNESRPRFGLARRPHAPIGRVVRPCAVRIERRMKVLESRGIRVGVRIRALRRIGAVGRRRRGCWAAGVRRFGLGDARVSRGRGRGRGRRWICGRSRVRGRVGPIGARASAARAAKRAERDECCACRASSELVGSLTLQHG